MDERRTAICEAVLDLAAEGGNRAVTHGAVDRRLDLPKGSTSYYFRTKRALLEADCARGLPAGHPADTPDDSRNDDRVALDTAARELGRRVAEALRGGGADVLPGVGEVPAHPDPTSPKENS